MKLFEPITIKSMELKNRIGLAPMLNMPGVYTTFAIQPATIEWFEARARGGAGFIMTGTFMPPLVTAPGAKERFAALVKAVHAHGARLGVQIGAGGPMLGTGPSTPPYPDELHAKKTTFEVIPRQMNLPGVPPQPVALKKEDIALHIEAFAAAAAVLKEAGVDCVELHCAHGGATLLCSFISPFYNRREDEYGGTWENRLRFPTDVIRRMRQAVGADYPLLVRLSADELLGERGITLEDTTRMVVPAMEAAGVDCFDVSQGSIIHAPEGITIPLYYPRGCYIHHAEAVKKATSRPVIGVGRIVDLDMAERFLEEGKADIIYMGRQLTADPDTPNKFIAGHPEDIRKCIGCLEGCGTPCPINYDIFPGHIPLTKAEKVKKVLVVGGGVAGMEAARVAALRGHDVTLVEKSAALGGVVEALSRDSLYAEFGNFVEYLGVQMRKLGVDVRVCQTVDADFVKKIAPDAVILATGAEMVVPEVALGKPGVMDHVTALRERHGIGKRVVVWGHIYGAELAISLAQEGKEVVLIGETGENALASHASNDRKYWVIRRLTDVNVVRAHPLSARMTNPQVFYHVQVQEITPEDVIVVDQQGKTTRLPYDTLIVSRGRKSNDALVKELAGQGREVFPIGDCAGAGNINKAVWNANEVARKL